MTNPFRFTDPGPYLHRVSITRPATGGTTDPTTGKFIPAGPATEILADTGRPNADVQDKRRVLERDASGVPTSISEADLFLEDESLVNVVEIGDTGTVKGEEYGEAGLDFEVAGIQRIDGTLWLRWL